MPRKGRSSIVHPLLLVLDGVEEALLLTGRFLLPGSREIVLGGFGPALTFSGVLPPLITPATIWYARSSCPLTSTELVATNSRTKLASMPSSAEHEVAASPPQYARTGDRTPMAVPRTKSRMPPSRCRAAAEREHPLSGLANVMAMLARSLPSPLSADGISIGVERHLLGSLGRRNR